MTMPSSIQYRGTHCAFTIDCPAPGVLVLVISGHDVGEFGPVPRKQLEAFFDQGDKVELYIDARATRGATTEVSSEWARWLAANKNSFSHVSMLTGTKYVQITAGFVRSFAGLEDVMRIYTDEAAFDAALAKSVADRG